MTPDAKDTKEDQKFTKDSIESGGSNFILPAQSLIQIQKDVIKIEKDLEAAKIKFEKSGFDLITILGLFVGLITYLGLEIQVFKIIDNPSLIIGISIFFIASILLFILTLHLILKKSEPVSWSDFCKQPLYFILIVLLIISIWFIIW